MCQTLTLTEHLSFLTVSWPIDLKRAYKLQAATWPRKDQWSMTVEEGVGVSLHLWKCLIITDIWVYTHPLISKGWSQINNVKPIQPFLFTIACFSFSFFFFVAYLCLIHRLSKICFGLYKHALIGTRPLPNEKCNLPRARRVLGRFSCAYIGYLRNLLFCNTVVWNRFYVWPQIKDVRQTKCLMFVPSPCVHRHQ